MINRTLEVDWWKRPTASDVLQMLESLFSPDAYGSVFYISEPESESDSSSSSLPLVSVPRSRSMSPALSIIEDLEIASRMALAPQAIPFPQAGADALLFIR